MHSPIKYTQYFHVSMHDKNFDHIHVDQFWKIRNWHRDGSAEIVLTQNPVNRVKKIIVLHEKSLRKLNGSGEKIKQCRYYYLQELKSWKITKGRWNFSSQTVIFQVQACQTWQISKFHWYLTSYAITLQRTAWLMNLISIN